MKLFEILDKDKNDVDSRGRVSFHALYEGKKKHWSVGAGLYELLCKLEAIQKDSK